MVIRFSFQHIRPREYIIDKICNYKQQRDQLLLEINRLNHIAEKTEHLIQEDLNIPICLDCDRIIPKWDSDFVYNNCYHCGERMSCFTWHLEEHPRKVYGLICDYCDVRVCNECSEICSECKMTYCNSCKKDHNKEC